MRDKVLEIERELVNLCLYGIPNETWEGNFPVDEDKKDDVASRFSLALLRERLTWKACHIGKRRKCLKICGGSQYWYIYLQKGQAMREKTRLKEEMIYLMQYTLLSIIFGRLLNEAGFNQEGFLEDHLFH